MEKPTDTDLKEFEEWDKKHPDHTITPKVIHEVVSDDVNEAKAAEEKRIHWDRQYNHPPDPVGKRKTAEGEKKPEEQND